LSVWQRPHQEIVRHREYGKTRAQTQRQRKNGGHGESPAAPETAKGKPDIAADRIKRRHGGAVAHGLLHRLQAAELQPGFPSRLLEAQARPHPVFDVQAHVRLELVHPLALTTGSAKPFA
jgi:hypothetical protein